MDGYARRVRIVLFTGKGGVGKTTLAAATAAHLARSGRKTLVVSTDPAHSLGDALEAHLDGDPAEVDGVGGLFAAHVDARGLVEGAWERLREHLRTLLAGAGVDELVADELTVLPGVEELLALGAVRRAAQSGPWDVVVVDCGPTAETLRLLALPEALAWHLERLLPAQRGLLRTLRPAAAAAAGLPLPEAGVIDAVTGWHKDMREVHRLLTGDQASVRLVLTPERVVIAESRRTWTSLSLYGFVVDAVVVNRVFPDARDGADGVDGGVPDPWRSSWNTAQQAGLVEVRESFAGLPVVVTPYLPSEPIGVAALAGLADAQDGSAQDRDALLSPVTHRGLNVERTEDGFLLTLPLPLAHASDLGLQRRDDELLVAVGEHRRVLTLPAALQRCLVEGASVRDGLLRVRFVPDEEVWPRG